MAIHSMAPPAAVAGQPAGPARRRRLPAGWPLLAILVLFPLWYALGLGGFITVILAAPMLAHLIMTRTWRIPRGFIIWLFFLGWICLSSIMISKGSNWFTFGYRLASYLAATVVFIYVLNIDEKALPTRRIINALTVFWAVIVVGGFAAMAAPHLSFSTPTQKLLGHLGSNKLLVALIHPTLAQAQALGGVAAIGHAIARPAAPFAYTNWWGANFAFLLPFVILAVRQTRTRWMRLGLMGLLVLSLVPFVYSINRGAWISIIVAGLYAWIRFAIRGRGRTALLGLVLLVVVGLAVLVSPLGGIVHDRLGHHGSASLRLTLIDQSAQGAMQSPVVGYGVPLPQPVSKYTLPNVGTQGQLWLVLVSVGIPGLFFFLLWLLYVFWNGRSPDNPASFAAHVALLAGFIQLPFYGWMPTEMFLVMTVAAFVWRSRDQLVPADRPLEAAHSGQAAWQG